MARDLVGIVSPPPSHSTVASCNLQLPGFSPPQACLSGKLDYLLTVLYMFDEYVFDRTCIKGSLKTL
jgi:hypothetical protein